MTEFVTLQLDVDGPVARLTLACPEKRNALTLGTLSELGRACSALQANAEVRVVVLSGEGPSFCVGFDLKAVASMFAEGAPSESELRALARAGRRSIDALRGLDAVTVASVHGHAVGGGFLLASACDFRVVADDTMFSVPELDLGVPLTWGGVPMLRSLLGDSLARQVVMGADPFGIEALAHTAFVSRCVPANELSAATQQRVDSLCAKPPGVLRETKRQFQAINEPLGNAKADEDRFVSAFRDPAFLSYAMTAMNRMSSQK